MPNQRFPSRYAAKVARREHEPEPGPKPRKKPAEEPSPQAIKKSGEHVRAQHQRFCEVWDKRPTTLSGEPGEQGRLMNIVYNNKD